jgi:para-nitrobenzyl esterase
VPRRHQRWHFSLFVALCAGVALAAPPEARIASGRIAGELTAEGVRVFRGIPFAAPPVGDLRWKDPQPAAKWAGVRDATRFGSRCMQPTGNVGGRVRESVVALPISEDCLYLNVWTSSPDAGKRLPVIVFTHGGTYTIGTGSAYSGTELARRGVVVVTHNYRLGAFGYLAHPWLTAESPHHSSGNYGLADQLAVLAWVQRNISAFGGDPARVTLAGQSAGGRMIQALRASQCARSLFRRAIIQSAPVRILRMTALADAERAGVATVSKVSATTLADLRNLTAQQVLENFPPGQPVIDGHCITADPLTEAASKGLSKVDLLVGSNADEGTFPYLRAKEFGVGFSNSADFSAYARDRFGAGVAAFFKAYAAESETDFNTAQLEAFRDEVAWNARYSALTNARHGKGSTYLYYFDHRPPAPASGPDRGATHGTELPYVFNMPSDNWTDDDRKMAGAMASYWANFAANGDPNGKGLSAWPAFVPGTSDPNCA